jgi:hypothetical protein
LAAAAGRGHALRKALNDNPVAQIGVLGALAVIVAFLLLTHVAGKSGGSGSAASAGTTSGAPTTPTIADGDSTAATAPSPAVGTAAPTTDPSSAPPAGATTGEFVAGPGLPATVVKAYADDKTVVLLVFRHRAVDDAAVRASVERLRGRSDLAVFVTHAAHIARYARITEGVDVNRVPALIVLRPRHLTDGTPTASVSYGFRGPDSVEQAIRDALYKGPSDLPYYPR